MQLNRVVLSRQGGAVTEQGYPPRQPGRNSHFGHTGHPGQAGPSGRPGRPRSAQEPRNDGWQVLGAFEPGSDVDSDLPPWAIPGGIEPMRPARRATRTAEAEPAAPEIAAEEPRPVRSARSGGSGRRPGRSRAAATRRRRSRRRLTTWGSVVAVAAVIAVAVYYLTEPSAPRPHLRHDLAEGRIHAPCRTRARCSRRPR